MLLIRLDPLRDLLCSSVNMNSAGKCSMRMTASLVGVKSFCGIQKHHHKQMSWGQFRDLRLFPLVLAVVLDFYAFVRGRDLFSGG